MLRLPLIVWCDRVMYVCLLLIAFFLPISTAISEVCSGLIILAYVIKYTVTFRALRHEQSCVHSFWQVFNTHKHPLTVPVLVFLYVVFLSVIASQFPFLSWKGFIGKTIQSIFLFFAVTACITTRRRLKVFIIIFLISAAFVSINGILQYFIKKDFIFGHPFTSDGRVMACFEHPNDFAAYLLIPLMLFISLSVWLGSNLLKKQQSADSRQNVFLVFLLVLGGVILGGWALGWTYSRGAWIGFGIAMIMMVLFNRKYWFVPLIGITIFCGVFVSQIASTRNVSFVSDNVTNDYETSVQNPTSAHPALLKTFSAMGRSFYWSQTIKVWQAAPIFGTGLNSYSAAAARYNTRWSGFYSHNCYLQMLAENGVVGLGSFLFIIYMIIRICQKSLRKLPNGFYRAVLLGLFTGWIGFLVHSSVDTNFYSARLANLIWVIMGLIVAVHLLSEKEGKNLHS